MSVYRGMDNIVCVKVVTIIALILALVVIIAGAVVQVTFPRGVYTFFPIRKIETLSSPMAVVGWKPEGLMLADGRTVQLPGFTKLPASSDVLDQAIRLGVEVDPSGQVIFMSRPPLDDSATVLPP